MCTSPAEYPRTYERSVIVLLRSASSLIYLVPRAHARVRFIRHLSALLRIVEDVE